MSDLHRHSHRLALAHGWGTGFWTMEQGQNPGGWLEYGVVVIPREHVAIRSVAAEDLGNPSFENIEQMYRAAHRYARSQGYVTGFALFEQGLIEGALYFGIAMLDHIIVDIESIPAAELGNPVFGDATPMFTCANRHARRKGYISGFPLFEQGIENGVLHFGTALVKTPAVIQSIPADVLSVFQLELTPAYLLEGKLKGNIIFNESGAPVYAKAEEGKEVIRIDRFCIGAFDGVATKYQDEGLVAKCPDLNIIYVDRNGQVHCYGPRKVPSTDGQGRVILDFTRSNTTYHNDISTLEGDTDWEPLFERAKLLTPQATPPAGDTSGVRQGDRLGGWGDNKPDKVDKPDPGTKGPTTDIVS